METIKRGQQFVFVDGGVGFSGAVTLDEAMPAPASPVDAIDAADLDRVLHKGQSALLGPPPPDVRAALAGQINAGPSAARLDGVRATRWSRW